MSSIRPLIPLLFAAGILLGGNGLQSTVIALRGAQEGFSSAMIGAIGTFYFAGFLLGCLVIVRMLQAVGHIRCFATLAAVASASTLVLVLAIDPVVWSLARFVSGFCFAGLFTVMESWMNSSVRNNDRAQALALYRIVDIVAVTGSQFLIPVVGVGGFVIFAIMSIMTSLSLVPVSLGDRSNPKPPTDVKLDLKRAWRISPLAALACMGVGVTNSAFRSLSPVYAEQIGMSVTDVVIFVSAGVIGGAIIQYPLGYMSDRWDRRSVLLGTSTCAMISALGLGAFAGNDPMLNFIGVFVFGAFAMPLYSLSAAHANDRAEPSEFVLVNAALMLFYSIGAILGPFPASVVMEWLGPQWLFYFSALVYGLLLCLIVWRIGTKSPVPDSARSKFVALLRTSTIFARLARRPSPRGDGEMATLDERGQD